MRIIPPEACERALTKVVMGPNGCHISTYGTVNGYARLAMTVDGKAKTYAAHRAAWTEVHGQIPVGMTVDHTCHNRRCVRVDHLRLLTLADNSQRNRAGLDYPVGQSCPAGHDPAERQLLGNQGYTACRACRREAMAERRRRDPERHRAYDQATLRNRQLEKLLDLEFGTRT